jgi:hypothetical protein
MYEVVHDPSNTSVWGVFISRKTMDLALKGDATGMKSVAVRYRRRVKKVFGRDPGWVDFEDLWFRRLGMLEIMP